MWFDKEGKMHTLEQDIIEIWKKHGLKVIKEKVEGNTWTIEAIRESEVND